jgi:hypothetical protein
VLGIAILVATFTGLTAQWGGNATFGGFDYIAALLWGFSLGTATTFTGIAAQLGVLPATSSS